jgi:hypothetical protein
MLLFYSDLHGAPLFNHNTNKMKKITIVIMALLFNMAFYSCTPQALTDETQSEHLQKTGGHDGDTGEEEEDPSPQPTKG